MSEIDWLDAKQVTIWRQNYHVDGCDYHCENWIGSQPQPTMVCSELYGAMEQFVRAIDGKREWSWAHTRDCNAWDTNYEGFTIERCTCHVNTAHIIVAALDGGSDE